MARVVLILGKSGTGKSRSIKMLDPKTTALINVISKELPWRGWTKQYTAMDSKTGKGNMICIDDSEKIWSTIQYINEQRQDIKTIVIDDFQYTMCNEFMRRHSSAGKGNGVFQLYNEIGDHAWNLIFNTRFCRKDLTIVFLSHSENDDQGGTKMKTIGKMLDDKVSPEGMFTVVLNTYVSDGQYYFQTQNNGSNTSKSPEGMFNSDKIPNDLKLVIDSIQKYDEGE